MKKDYYLIIDTETTINDKVADFGAVICDRKGNIADQCGVLVSGVFGIDPCFISLKKMHLLYGQNKAKTEDLPNTMKC